MKTQKLREELETLRCLAEKIGYNEDRSGTEFTLRDRTQEISVEKYGIPVKPNNTSRKQVTFLDPSGEGLSNPQSFGCYYDGAWSEFPERFGLMGLPGAHFYGPRYREIGNIGFLLLGKIEKEEEFVSQFDTHPDLVNAARAYVAKGDDFHTVLRAKHAHTRLDSPVEVSEVTPYMARILSLAGNNAHLNVANEGWVDEYIRQFSFRDEEEEVKRRSDVLGDDFRNHVDGKRLEFGNGAIEIDAYRDAVFGYYEYKKAQADLVDIMAVNNYRIEQIKGMIDLVA